MCAYFFRINKCNLHIVNQLLKEYGMQLRVTNNESELHNLYTVTSRLGDIHQGIKVVTLSALYLKEKLPSARLLLGHEEWTDPHPIECIILSPLCSPM